MEPEEPAPEPEDGEDPDEPSRGPGDWTDYPWRRAVVACHDRDDLDSWPCPACKHPLAFHAVHGSTTTNAFAKRHGQDYRFSCDAHLFIGEGVGSLAEPGDEKVGCACEFHGIAGGADWPAEYRPLYRYLDVAPDTFNDCEPAVEMTREEWGPYEPAQRGLDEWA